MLLSGEEDFSINLDGYDISNTLSQKLIGVTIDNKMLLIKKRVW